MRRREFITLLGGPAVLATRAQPGTGLAYIRVCFRRLGILCTAALRSRVLG
ncbi:MAG: hypothetical protein WAO13_12555 [Pseudolabrys sp.]